MARFTSWYISYHWTEKNRAQPFPSGQKQPPRGGGGGTNTNRGSESEMQGVVGTGRERGEGREKAVAAATAAAAGLTWRPCQLMKAKQGSKEVVSQCMTSELRLVMGQHLHVLPHQIPRPTLPNSYRLTLASIPTVFLSAPSLPAISEIGNRDEIAVSLSFSLVKRDTSNIIALLYLYVYCVVVLVLQAYQHTVVVSRARTRRASICHAF
ncbi:hypothetical protein BCV70DRAFT_17046 [Testicularia cyperi]|uniref:Uncharacterized protein n=1 Tax=Testicularia cyperi TaxID=1882483 RepID=A0A317XYR4_9BASI|nr:hypothetical protein BCV70DRAFT_17046 [Testicularia cyperi]